MSVDMVFNIGWVLLLGCLTILQLHIRHKVKKIAEQSGQELSEAAKTRMSPKATFQLGLFHMVFYTL